MLKTIIIQGTTENSSQLQQIINQIRTWFKDEIVISTWYNQKVNLTGYDKLVLSSDPGPGPFNGLLPVEQHCNLKRQLCGLKRGLEASSGSLVFKIRNDCLVTKDIFQYYNFVKGEGKYKFIDNKIIVSNIMTTNPDFNFEPRAWFRISDWFYLGLKEDLQKMCNVYENLDETDFSNTFFGTEHILSFNIIKKYIFQDLTINKYLSLINDSWDYILGNFIVLDTISTAGIRNIGKWQNQPEYLPCYLTQAKYGEKLNEFRKLNGDLDNQKSRP